MMNGDGEERVCTSCGSVFTWTRAQAEWLRRRVENAGGEYHPPSRCRRCQAEEAVRQRPGMHLMTCWRCLEPFAAVATVRGRALCRACLEEGSGSTRNRVRSGKGEGDGSIDN